MKELVSVIIPCFNAEKWIEEAIESCLNQTYENVEIIVIDDGSTQILADYGNQIIWESGPNRGGCYARNRGFNRSKGAFIQYLDADDYLLPQKLEKQVEFLQSTKADAVYSDWRQQKHLQDGSIVMGEIQICGPQSDFLELALSHNQWIQTANPLFTRAAIAHSEGWDESLKGAQDVDFFIALAINQTQFVYLPGCYTIYRQYSNVGRVSANKINSWMSRLSVIEKTETKLTDLNIMSDKHKQALALMYFQIGIFGCCYLNYYKYLNILQKTKKLYPSFVPDYSFFQSGYVLYNLTNRLFGYKISCVIYKLIKDIVNFLKTSSQRFSLNH
jgi:glycosyltransferase involved in cell wall biosynthesis